MKQELAIHKKTTKEDMKNLRSGQVIGIKKFLKYYNRYHSGLCHIKIMCDPRHRCSKCAIDNIFDDEDSMFFKKRTSTERHPRGAIELHLRHRSYYYYLHNDNITFVDAAGHQADLATSEEDISEPETESEILPAPVPVLNPHCHRCGCLKNRRTPKKTSPTENTKSSSKLKMSSSATQRVQQRKEPMSNGEKSSSKKKMSSSATQNVQQRVRQEPMSSGEKFNSKNKMSPSATQNVQQRVRQEPMSSGEKFYSKNKMSPSATQNVQQRVRQEPMSSGEKFSSKKEMSPSATQNVQQRVRKEPMSNGENSHLPRIHHPKEKRTAEHGFGECKRTPLEADQDYSLPQNSTLKSEKMRRVATWLEDNFVPEKSSVISEQGSDCGSVIRYLLADPDLIAAGVTEAELRLAAADNRRRSAANKSRNARVHFNDVNLSKSCSSRKN